MSNKPIYLTVLLICLGISTPLFSFPQVKAVPLEQLDSLQKMEKRPVFVFLYTSWCTYCSAMKNTTFTNAEVIKRLNQKFYFIALDIEEKRTIYFQAHTFRYRPTGPNTGIHQLAEQLGTINGVLAYPTLCFLNADNEIIYQREGFIQAKELLEILVRLQ